MSSETEIRNVNIFSPCLPHSIGFYRTLFLFGELVNSAFIFFVFLLIWDVFCSFVKQFDSIWYACDEQKQLLQQIRAVERRMWIVLFLCFLRWHDFLFFFIFVSCCCFFLFACCLDSSCGSVSRSTRAVVQSLKRIITTGIFFVFLFFFSCYFLFLRIAQIRH